MHNYSEKLIEKLFLPIIFALKFFYTSNYSLTVQTERKLMHFIIFCGLALFLIIIIWKMFYFIYLYSCHKPVDNNYSCALIDKWKLG